MCISTFKLEFDDYSKIVRTGFEGVNIASLHSKLFAGVYDRMLSFKPDFMTFGALRCLYLQLLTGVRFVEISGLRVKMFDDGIGFYVTSVKGTEDRVIRYRISSPMLSHLFGFLTTEVIPMSYKVYRRTLKNANPNFYNSFDNKHLCASHLARHFYVQFLSIVLRLPRGKVQSALGWHRCDTIDSYIDMSLFLNNVDGGLHVADNNNVTERKHVARPGRRRLDRGVSADKKNIKKKVKKINS